MFQSNKICINNKISKYVVYCVMFSSRVSELYVLISFYIFRSCPDVSKIYILMRPKKGVEIEKRLEELTKNLVRISLLSTIILFLFLLQIQIYSVIFIACISEANIL